MPARRPGPLLTAWTRREARGTESWAYRARVLVHAPAATVTARIPLPLDITEVDATTCRVELGADDPEQLALWLAQLDVDVEVVDGDDLADAFARLAARFRRAAGAAAAG